jgi:hypothetical protein
VADEVPEARFASRIKITHALTLFRQNPASLFRVTMIASMPLLRIIAVCLHATLSAVAQRGAPNVIFGHIHINSADPD